MISKFKWSFSALVLIVTLSSCKKDKYGDADIISSNELVLNNWVQLYNDGVNYEHQASVSWDAINQAAVDKGALTGYLKDAGVWVALPYGYADEDFGVNINFMFSSGNIKVNASGYSFTGSVPASTFNGYAVRFVLVTPNVKAANPDVDWSNYEMVSARFGLK
ncbi:MAG TPA: hypothetical protein PK637_03610 [Flavobacteriales bacterium]|nr:hypothetical protein [Flavobacteriales bacterium]HRE75347.1 hypothetical protein [Flavobacteriales bacterium]HRE95825.1 hypothetical protein [Flavobacteriales bacterium]HRJ35172.1 hypothetical protein [Flavobacteriales bacterium]HRJ37592.1 hypothetical protein [Flavobacteriales bacterium]